jgi:hypothetical protein
MFEEYEKIDNIKLIRNNLRHISCELGSDELSPMRLTKECHQLLLRIMVEALRGTANLSIAGKPTKVRKHWHRPGDGPWQSIKKENIEGCTNAWRYSDPIPEEPPPPKDEEDAEERLSDAFLIGFYDLLAMIQEPCFMLRYAHSAIVSIPDSKMKLLEWLHENIRNEYEHFMPKTLLASSADCFRAAEVCLRIAHDLLTKSNNIAPYNIDDLPKAIKAAAASLSEMTADLKHA